MTSLQKQSQSDINVTVPTIATLPSAASSTRREAGPRLQRVAFLAACVLALAIGSVGLTDESYASSDGDMARYLMDGAFVHDLVADHPLGGVSQFLEYTRLYYARYPAISLGHHPVLLAVLEAPAFALFGISIGAARLIPLASFLLAVVCLYGLVNPRYGAVAAFWTTILFATSPMIVAFSRIVMAEMPAIALLLASAYLVQRFAETGRRFALWVSCLAFVLSVYAKPMAIVVAPALLGAALVEIGPKRLLKRDVLLAAASAAIVAAPAVVVPLMLSSSNLNGVIAAVHLESKSTFAQLLWAALEPQLAWPVLAAAAVAAVRAIVRRDRFAVLFLLWVVSVLPALYFFGGLDEGKRYTLYWVPALCALAGSLVVGWQARAVRFAVIGILAGAVVMHVLEKRTVAGYLTHMGGYEEAAKFVLSANPGPTVLFSGDVDTGYFAFFVRKHDPARHLVVLRSDKVYTTSLMALPNFEDRIGRRDEIYTALHQFGTRYVVIEDAPSKSRVLEWLREELKSAHFVERRRIPIRSTDVRLRDTSLAIYELLDPTPPASNAVLSLHMPIVGQSLTVTLRDLIDRKLLR